MTTYGRAVREIMNTTNDVEMVSELRSGPSLVWTHDGTVPVLPRAGSAGAPTARKSRSVGLVVSPMARS